MIKSILFLVLLISFSALIFSLPPNPQCSRSHETEDDDHRSNCKKVVNQFIAFLSQEEAYFTSENNIEIENTTSTYNPFEISASNPFYNNPWGTVLLQLAGNTDNSSFGNRNYQFQYAILLNPTVNFGSIDIFIGERCSNGSSVVQLLTSSDSNSTTDGLTGSFDASDLKGDLTNSGLSDLLANIRDSNASIGVNSAEDDDTNSTSTFVLKGKIIEVGKSYIIYDAFEKLSTLENLETLSELIELTNLTEFVRTQNNYTLFAPTNQAIADAAARLNITTYDNTTLPVLSRLLQYHVVSGIYTSGDFTNNTITLNTVLTSSEGNGTTIVVTGNESCNFSINNGQAEIIVPDLEAANAVIHVVNSVLLPEDLNVLLE